MRLPLILSCLAASACGGSGLTYVVDIIPIYEPSGPSGGGGGGGGGGDTIRAVPTMDVVQGVCLNSAIPVGSPGRCSAEPFTIHQARVTVRNDRPANAEQPLAGRDELRSYDLALEPIGTGPEFRTSGGVSVVVPPETEVSFVVILGDLDAKATIGAQLTGFAAYRARYTFKGPAALEISGSTTLDVGDFVSCDEGDGYASSCPNAVP